MKCIFCIVSSPMAENEFVCAIYDKFPVNPGHVLIIPKRHVKGHFDLTHFHVHVPLIPGYYGDVDAPEGGVRGVIPSGQKY